MDARLTAAITSPLRPCQTPSLRSFFDSMNRLSIHAKDRRPVTGERTIFTSGAFMEAMEYVSETSGEHGGIGRLRTRPPVAMFPLSQTSATKTVHEFVGAMYAVSAHGRVGPAGNQESRPGRTPTARGLIGIKAGRMEQPLARGMDDARSEETSREDGARGCEGETTCENKARSGVASQGEAGLEGKVTTVGGRKITAVSQRRGGYALTDFLQAMRRTVAMGPRRPAVESPQATVTDERIDERVVERPWEGDPEATTSPADTQKTVRPGFAESAAAQLSSSSKPGSLLGVAAGAVGPRISMLFKNHCLDYSLYRRFKAVVTLTSRYWSTTRLGVLPGGEDGHECGVANVVDAFEAAATQRERAMRATNGSMTIAASTRTRNDNRNRRSLSIRRASRIAGGATACNEHRVSRVTVYRRTTAGARCEHLPEGTDGGRVVLAASWSSVGGRDASCRCWDRSTYTNFVGASLTCPGTGDRLATPDGDAQVMRRHGIQRASQTGMEDSDAACGLRIVMHYGTGGPQAGLHIHNRSTEQHRRAVLM